MHQSTFGTATSAADVLDYGSLLDVSACAHVGYSLMCVGRLLLVSLYLFPGAGSFPLSMCVQSNIFVPDIKDNWVLPEKLLQTLGQFYSGCSRKSDCLQRINLSYIGRNFG